MLIALGRRITKHGVQFIANHQKRPRGARLWGIGIGWTFFGFVSFPFDDVIRASDNFVDGPDGVSDLVLGRHDSDDVIA